MHAEVQVRLGVVLRAVVDVVGRDERQLEAPREVDEDAVQDRLLGEAVVLQLDVERARLEAAPSACRASCAPASTPSSRTRCATTPPMQPVSAMRPFVRPSSAVERDARHARRRRPDRARRTRARRARRGSCSPPPSPRAAGGGAPCWPADDLELGAEDRLHAQLLGGLVEGDRAEHVAVVGQGHGAHALLLDLLDEVLHLHRAVQHRVLRVDVEVDEVGHFQGACVSRRAAARKERRARPCGRRVSRRGASHLPRHRRTFRRSAPTSAYL